MESLIKPLASLLVFASLVGLAVLVLRYLKKSAVPSKVNLPYIKKEYLLTVPERKLFSLLTHSVPQGFYVFPQVHLDSLMLVRKGTQKRIGYLNKITRKSVDFAIFTQDTLTPVLAIELDDSTHAKSDRMDRDDFVDNVLSEVGIGVLHIRSSQLDSVEEIRDIIMQKLGVTN